MTTDEYIDATNLSLLESTWTTLRRFTNNGDANDDLRVRNILRTLRDMVHEHHLRIDIEAE